jgi:zinc protease
MNIRFISKTLAIFAMSGIVAFAKYDPNSTEKIPLSKDVKTGVLKNGMTYFIKKNAKPEEHGHFRIVLKAGAICEDDDQNGLAHFTEHMCFNGTKDYPKNQLLDVLQKFGIEFGGDVNASTGWDVTMYELPISLKDPKLVETSFNVLKEWAHNVAFEGDQIDGERGVIVSEWRQRNNVNGRLQEKHSPVTYFGSKYAKRNVIGDTTLLMNFKHDVIRRFYHDWYRPDLMAIVAVGDFDVDKIEGMVKQYFNDIPNPENERKREEYTIPFHKDTKISIAKDGELPNEMATIYTKLPKIDVNTYKGYAETQRHQLYDIMFNLRLQELSQQENTPFIRVSAGEGDWMGNIRCYFSSIISKPNSMKKAMESYLAEVARVKQHGFNQSELDIAKKYMKSSLENMKQTSKTIEHGSVVEEATTYFADGGNMGGVDFDYEFGMQVIEEAKLADLNKLAANYVTPENTVITISLPERSKDIKKVEILDLFNNTLNQKVEGKKEEKIDKPLFTKNVKPGKIVKSDKNEKLGIETLELSNGAKVILKPTKFKDDEINLYAFSQGGTSLYKDKDLMSAMFSDDVASEGGLGEFDKVTLGKVLAGVTAGVGTYVSNYTEGLQGSSNNKDFETMFQLANLKMSAPREDKKAFDTWTNKIKPSLERKGDNSDQVYRDSVNWIMADRNLREKPVQATDIDKIDFKRSLEIYKERFESAGDFTFVLVGDFDANKAKEYFAKYIASLPEGDKEKFKDVGVRYPKKAVVSEFQKGKEDKAHVRLTIHGDMPYTLENRHNLRSLAEAIEIRMIEEIREKMGGTYSPGVWTSSNKIPAEQYAFNIDFVTEPKRVKEMIDGCVAVINKFKQAKDEEATDKVKKAQLNKLDINLKENDYWMSVLSSYTQNGEDLNNILKNKELIDGLNADKIFETAKKYLNTETMIQVIEMPETGK